MIKVPKFLFYVIAIIILCVCITFCVLAVVNNEADGLISNITLTITSILGLVITVKDDTSKEENLKQLIEQAKTVFHDNGVNVDDEDDENIF